MSTATAWAWARSLAHRQKATSPSADAGSNDPSIHHRAGRSHRPARHSQAAIQIDHARPGCLARQTKASRCRSLATGSAATVRRDPPTARARVADASEKSCASSTSTCSNRRPQPAARSPRRSASRIRSPASRAPASASIRSWTRYTSANSCSTAAPRVPVARLCQPQSPAGVLLRPHQMRLEPVDPADEPGEQGMGAPAEVVAHERQSADPSSSMANRSAGPSTGSSGSMLARRPPRPPSHPQTAPPDRRP